MTWQDPYGQYPEPIWQDPYAQQGYDPYYGPPGATPPPASNGATIAALVCNIVSAVLCCIGVVWIPGVILAAVALGRNAKDPESARKLTVWSWVCLGINVLIAIAIIFVILAVSHGHTQTNNGYNG